MNNSSGLPSSRGWMSGPNGFAILAVILVAILSTRTDAGDWPMYRHDPHRSSITDEQLAFPMTLAWRYDAPQPPAPAWPEPIRILNRMDFDYAPHPVIAGGMVFLASCSDDTLRAFDAATGRERWHFVAGGPLRFAPQIESGRVYIASDDGCVYCLDTATGKTVWIFNAAPVDEWMIGNGRMISRWPIRTGVLVVDGSVYVVAGIWPTEGLYAYSLDAATGKINWCNDTCGGIQTSGVAGGKWNPGDPHASEFGGAGLTPQGAMLVDKHVLIVPLANNAPAVFNRLNGALLNFSANSSGGANVIMDGDTYYRPIQGKGPVTIFGSRAPSRGAPNRAVTFPANLIPQLEVRPHGAENPIRAQGKMSFLVKDEKLTAKAAYGLMLSGGTLLVGGSGTLSAIDQATDKEVWSAKVDGEARELAVADGRLYVATNRGTLYCFASSGGTTTELKASAPLKMPNVSSVPNPVLQQIDKAGITCGYALVIGDPDGQLAVALASQTRLHVIMPITDAIAAQALRERLIANTNFYGSRIHVHHVASVEHLPFAQYFANVVIVASDAEKIPGKELYRVAQPCGGLILAPGLSPEKADNLMRESGALKGEVVLVDNGKMPAISRGPLPGARDWNTGDEPDRLVKWPLRPIWFGGPASELGMFSLLGQHPPVAAAGRYFILGDATLSAVDAYNGVVLWTRPIPSIYQSLRKIDGVFYPIADSPKNEYPQINTVLRRRVGADDRFVYLSLGMSYFHGEAEACIKLDVRSGQQVAMYAPFSSGKTVALDHARTWPIEVDKLRDASVTMETSDAGLTITLNTKTPEVTPLDSWDLFFDFRTPESRYGLYERGVLQLIISPARDATTPATWKPGVGAAHPQIQLTGTRTTTGSATKITLPWSEVEKLIGHRPQTFAFGATLTMHNGENESPIVQRHLFCDAAASGINNGWATMLLGPESQIKPVAIPSVVLGPITALPTEWTRSGAVNPEGIDESIRASPRVHPLTGELVPRIYRSGAAGCGRITFSQTSAFGRAGKLSISLYDFEDDSGLRNFAGIASNCGPGLKSMSIQAALGLLISSEARSHCDCMVPIRTSVAFAPAERPLNEDWATFFDRNVDTQVRQAAINFGAPGDKRDASQQLWLGFPRPGGGGVFPLEAASRHVIFTAPPISSCLQLPIEVERFTGGGPIRVSADRVTIAGADRRPWIYTSAFQGIQKATLHVDFLKPMASNSIDKSPDDSPLGDPQATLPFTKTSVFVRHDANNLYITAQRPAVTDRTGKIQPWSKSTKGSDVAVWDDDAFELFATDADGKRVVHLGVAASGACFDAISPRADAAEDLTWNGAWTSTVSADEAEFKARIAIPFKTLSDAGLDVKSLRVNFQMNQKNLTAFMTTYPGADSFENPTNVPASEPMASLGYVGRARCENFAPLGLGSAPAPRPRNFTVRLHFAELSGNEAGDRVFDVKLQGVTVLDKFDIVREAGAQNKAIVKEFNHVQAGEAILLEFIPKAKLTSTTKSTTLPLLNALEVYDEEARRPATTPILK